MLVAIQAMTGADALAKLTPYDDVDANSTAHLFLDIEDNYTLKGIFFDGAAPNDKKIVSISTNRVTKKTYKALLNQAGGAAPVATVLENSLSADIVWNRTGAGVYAGTLFGEFTAGLTFVMVGQSYNLKSDTWIKAYANTVNQVGVETIEDLGGATAPVDGELFDNAIEVTVYEVAL